MCFHSSCLFVNGQPLLVDFNLCTPPLVLSFSPSCLFDTGRLLLVDIDLCASIRLVFFDFGQPLLVEFD